MVTIQFKKDGKDFSTMQTTDERYMIFKTKVRDFIHLNKDRFSNYKHSTFLIQFTKGVLNDDILHVEPNNPYTLLEKKMIEQDTQFLHQYVSEIWAEILKTS